MTGDRDLGIRYHASRYLRFDYFVIDAATDRKLGIVWRPYRGASWGWGSMVTHLHGRSHPSRRSATAALLASLPEDLRPNGEDR